MNFKEFKKFKNNNNLLFSIHIAKKMSIDNNADDPDKQLERGYADEVSKYRSNRFNCERTGSVISKIKINL